MGEGNQRTDVLLEFCQGVVAIPSRVRHAFYFRLGKQSSGTKYPQKTEVLLSDEILMLLMQLRPPGSDWRGVDHGHGDLQLAYGAVGFGSIRGIGLVLAILVLFHFVQHQLQQLMQTW